MIRLTGAELLLGGKVIFSDLSWRVDVRQRIGLVGPNGSGKSSILRVLVGEHPLNKGDIEMSKNLRLGYLPQDGAELPRETVAETLWRAFGELNAKEEAMADLLAQIESAGHGDPARQKTLERYGRLQEEFQRGGGYEREANAKKVLTGLGFKESDWERPVAEFSGGWRMRVLLAKLLLEDPDILLLDEPTNHLDTDTLEWLEQYLSGMRAGLVIVSHDRYFLDRMVKEIAEIERRNFRVFPGNYTDYKRKKEELRAQLIAEKKNQDRQIAHLERFVERFRAKATKATQAQSRIKQLEKIERIEIEDGAATVSIPMPETPRGGKEVLTLSGASRRYGDLVALKPTTVTIYRGDRIAVWGPNGAGKTTLLSLMAKVLEPTEGAVEWGYNTHIAYFSQQQAELQESNNSVLDELSGAAPAEMQTRLRDMLGVFLFRGDDVFKPVRVLSGGEKSRLALAKLLVRPCNVLIMDEPLNHLDISTVETLENALREYEGTLVFVSHDRFFASRLATQIWEMKQGVIRTYPGNFQDYEYMKSLEREDGGGQPAPPPKNEGALTREDRKEQKRREAEERNRRSAARRDIEKRHNTLEEEILETETEIEELEARLADPEFAKSPEIAEAGRRYKTLQERKDALYAEWEEVTEQLETL